MAQLVVDLKKSVVELPDWWAVRLYGLVGVNRRVQRTQTVRIAKD
ncbi:hypothetical protein [Natrinema soli]|uniref:Transposase n=1 Tax=Natrinema soli TaxID=1930624 RepID=A0ABD5SSC7_9EURY|nr:hypothetical protein [Natrinema soli]